MKKAMMFVCVLAMAFSAVGCGGNDAEQPETQQEVQKEESEEKQTADGVDEQAVYDYFNNLIQSKENPALREKIGNEDMDPKSEEAKQIGKAWGEECEAYDEKCEQETAEKFGITIDEVLTIYYERIHETYGQ